MTTIIATPAGRPRPILGDAATTVPPDLQTALAGGAFAGLRAVVGNLGPTGTVATIAASGLRGRGGAGYPAGTKWRAVAGAADPVRYVVGNGYEADPAQVTNRVLMEARPFAVVEGIAIAALAVGAQEAIIAVRAEYADAVAALTTAVFAAEEAGFLGRDILGSGRDVAVTVRTVQGAYMLGEETVLLAALEGRRGQPEQRPPYPTERGLFGHPTLVHNVATIATAPWIVVHGADAFRAIGDPAAPGTVLVGLSGAVANAGIVEIPTGTTLRQLLELGGGVAAGHAFKAALVGGPSGGFLPAELLDTPYSFDALRATGAHVGSGGVVIVDERACLVDLARLLVRYGADEACGKTIPCRIGLRRLAEIGQRYADGTARPADPKLVADLADDCAASALCDHERLAPSPLRTALRYFGPEIDDHLLRGVCPAGVCSPIRLPAAAAGR
ncbi:MAG TPA: NADH-ubiquinone oxidoreductase-F iron-sulfur binding region domain-containing protein [Patescibacteria group bacterium]|nr:NADH-ubiquinone oxidoreductase-F iron-sulfur binding region domain-containing protein [Patescibacteria group bacterium]